MGVNSVFLKDPDAELDFEVDWADWLATGETISSVAWDVPAGIAHTTDSKSSTAATIWLSSGTPGNTYSIGCQITTSSTRSPERTIQIVVVER